MRSDERKNKEIRRDVVQLFQIYIKTLKIDNL